MREGKFELKLTNLRRSGAALGDAKACSDINFIGLFFKLANLNCSNRSDRMSFVAKRPV